MVSHDTIHYEDTIWRKAFTSPQYQASYIKKKIKDLKLSLVNYYLESFKQKGIRHNQQMLRINLFNKCNRERTQPL